MSKKKQQKRSIEESCEGILAVLKAGQRQLEYLAHEHLDFGQVLRLEERIRVGSSPERAEIQRMRLLLDARLDHVQQMRALSSLAPLTLTPMDEKRFKEVAKIATPSPPPPKPPAKEAPVVSEEKPTETHQEAKNTEEPLENLKEPPIRTPESVTAAESNTPATKAPSTPAPASRCPRPCYRRTGARWTNFRSPGQSGSC